MIHNSGVRSQEEWSGGVVEWWSGGVVINIPVQKVNSKVKIASEFCPNTHRKEFVADDKAEISPAAPEF